MKKVLIIPLFILISFIAFAHGGEEHGETKVAVTGAKYFSSEALSDKYEVLIRHGELLVNKPSVLQLFLSDAKSNKAIDSAIISMSVVGNPKLKFTITRVEPGIYKVEGLFPAKDTFAMQVNIKGPSGADFLQVPQVLVGYTLTKQGEEAHTHWYSNPWLLGGLGLISGLLLMYFVMKRRYNKVAAVVLIFCLLLPTAGMNPIIAHGGDDHGAGGSGGGMASTFIVEKESQFLFNILTQKAGESSLTQSAELTGTVTASPQGMAVIQSPQTGKIVSLRVNPGQTVSAGQTLAVVEQQVEAGTQIDIISQRNSLNAEAKAAKVQYDRLKSIEDIAAKKDVTEAKARYDAAVQNLRLFNSNIGGGASTKLVTLTSPISGVVGTFNYAIGAVVSSGQTLFEITNLNKVYVETQVFANADSSNTTFVTYPANDTTGYRLRLVSVAQSVNEGNQAQRVIFEILNPGNKFRIGENVRVLKSGGSTISKLVVPTAAVVDINGKPAVFIKDKAEQYSLSFIQKGQSNTINTVIEKGAEAGERIVTGNVYQMKMIFLGQ